MPRMIIPTFHYRDAPAAIDFLERAFGFERGQVFEGEGERQIAHAELRHGDGWVMLGSAGGDGLSTRPGSGTCYVVTEDVDALHARAVAAGAEIVRELRDTDYGSRDFSARDPEGNVWNFGTYAPA
ncbi:MAG TPA: VOC family protein [Solirubrobacteraceae bacterium]|nr:VOC family protein [Solirubrobacteraceae bacterium]